jgi:hypothetical protein
LNTTFDASVVVYHLFNLLWSNFGITHNSSFGVLMIASFILLGFSAIWPRGVGHFSSLGDWMRSKEPESTTPAGDEELPPPKYRDVVPDSLVLPGEALVPLDSSTTELLAPAVTEEAPSAALDHLSFVQQLQTPEFLLFIFFHLVRDLALERPSEFTLILSSHRPLLFGNLCIWELLSGELQRCLRQKKARSCFGQRSI